MNIYPKLVCLIVLLGCTTVQKKLVVPSALSTLIGIESSKIIQEADTVIAYSLNPQIEPKENSFNGFAVIGESVNLNKVDFYDLKKIVLNKETYFVNDKVQTSCAFLPELGFRFTKNQNDKQEYTDLLVSFFCDKWMFKVADGNKIESCEKVKQELLFIAKESFPDSQYFQSL